MKKMFLLVATLLLLSAALLTGCQSSSINLMDYVTVTFSGLDGQGSASCTLDTVALEKELLGDKAGQLTQETAEKMATIAQFEASLTLAPDRQDTLSNGDTVTVTVTGNGTLAQQLGLSGLDSTKSFSVEGLQEPIEVDAFDSAFFNTGRRRAPRIRRGVTQRQSFDCKRLPAGTGFAHYLYRRT